MNAADKSVAPTIVAPTHTPGPWRLNKDDLTVRGIGGVIVHEAPFDKPDREDVANAHLITAAPVLLDLVTEAIDADDYGPEDWERWNSNAKLAVDLATPTEEVSRQLSEADELVEVRPVTAFEVWVRLKKSSKYYHQGLQVPHDSKSKSVFFKLDGFKPQQTMSLMRDGYSLQFNSNSYRPEDCEFFLVDPKETKRFVRIA